MKDNIFQNRQTYIKHRINRVLYDFAGVLHNLAVEDLYKTGKVVYSPFNKILLEISRILSKPFEREKDRHELHQI